MSTPFRHFLPAICGALLLFPASARAQQLDTTNSPGSALTTPTEASAQKVATAIQRANSNDLDGALENLTEAITLNPRNSGAYVLRASIYCQRKLWAQAEDDFKAAAQIAPGNFVLKFNLVEVKFMQKEYDAARPGFVALQSDPDMGDLAAYKVFLCDLFGGHESVAKQELDAFDKVDGNPSYYFSNAAWCLVHKDIETARGWLVSAAHIYPPQKNTYYAQSLRDLGYLPLPQPKQD